MQLFEHGDFKFPLLTKVPSSGNLLERVESGFEKSVSSLVELRRGLLLTGSDEDSTLRYGRITVGVRPDTALNGQ